MMGSGERTNVVFVRVPLMDGVSPADCKKVMGEWLANAAVAMGAVGKRLKRTIQMF